MNYNRVYDEWIRKCLPIVIQPEVDVRAGNGLEAIFYHYHPLENEFEINLVWKVRSVTLAEEFVFPPPPANHRVPTRRGSTCSRAASVRTRAGCCPSST